MKILCTGDLGFIGEAFAREMRDHDHEVIGFDIKRSENEDVTSYRAFRSMLSLHKPDVVVHLAAEVGRLNCELNAMEAMRVNQWGTRCVAKACAFYDTQLVYVSTSEVYGDHGDEIVDEETVENTAWFTGMYATTKFAGEIIAHTYAPPGLRILRPTMPYGPGVPPGPGRRALDNLIYQALTCQPMVVHKGAARSWCWIDDIASGMRYAITHGEPGIYNVGRDDEISMERLADEILELLDINKVGKIRIVDPPSLQTVVKRISCAKLRHLGWAPETELEVGLPKMVDWMKSWIHAEDCQAANQ